jgi:REP element-mobilizing transposase RayT
MSKLVRKSHNVSELLYHYVYTAKYRRLVYDQTTDKILNKVCLEIAKRYQIEFIELGTDKGHVHFLIQSTPRYSPTQIIQTVKRLTVREIFKQAPDVKHKLWGGEYLPDGIILA